MHRRSRCAVFRAHMRRAGRWTLAWERPCWARHCTTTACPEIIRGGRLLPSLPTSRVVDFSRTLALYPNGIFPPGPAAYPNIFHPRLELLTFPEGWRPARVRFSPSRGTNSDIFRPILESLAFPRDRWPPCRIFTKPWRQAGHFLHIP